MRNEVMEAAQDALEASREIVGLLRLLVPLMWVFTLGTVLMAWNWASVMWIAAGVLLSTSIWFTFDLGRWSARRDHWQDLVEGEPHG